MSRFKLIMILAVVIIAAVMQWRGVQIRAREADLRQEVASLEKQEASQHSTHAPSKVAAPRTKRGSRPQGETPGTKSVDASEAPVSDTKRLTIAIANGDLTEATRIFCLIQKEDPKRWALDRITEAVTTHEDQRYVLEQAGKSADQATFTLLGQSIARKSTFEANLDLLARAELTPGKRDLAAAIIAGANIDDNTPARAAWLLGSLQTDQAEPITHFAKSWTQGDFRAATTWVNTLPPGRARDAAVVGFAPVAARLDGASAVDWALTITDPVQRKSTLDLVTETWKSREPEAAAAYLQAMGIAAD